MGVLSFVFFAIFTLGFLGNLQVQSSPFNFEVDENCPLIPGSKDVKLSTILGTWFVGYHFNVDRPPCQAINFKETTDKQLRIGASMLITANITLLGSGTGLVKDIQQPSQMRWKWAYASGYDEDVTVVDTDNENYMVLVVCATYRRTRRVGALILTKKFTSSEIYFKRAQTVLAPYIDVAGEMKFQEECLVPTSPNGVQYINLNHVYSRYADLAPMFQALRIGHNVTSV